jgi:site-specific recombinase XerD
MTMENEALIGYRDYPAQARTLERILQKLSAKDLPGAPYLEQYLRHMHRRDLTVSTLRAAFTTIQGFLTFLRNQGKTDLLSVVHNDLEAFVECLQDRGLKPLSVENNLRHVKTFLRYWIQGKVISSEVLSRRISIKVPKPLPRAMDPLDVKRLLAAVQKVRDRAMILVLLRTGIRIGELLSLRVSDVYLPERKIHLVVGEKNRTGRVVYLSADAGQALQEWMRKRDAGKPLLIYGQGRSSLTYTAARMMFQRYLKKAGIGEKGYSLHGLRHTCATELLNAGMRIECLQQVLGHSNLEQTRRYARLTDKTREEEYFRAMARIEGREQNGEGSPREVPAVFEETQLLYPHDQDLYEYPGALPELGAAAGGRSEFFADLGLYRVSAGPGLDPEDD